MTLLLAILLFAPMPKPDVPVLEIVPPSRTITLAWNNSPTPGASNRLCWGESPVALTNRFEVGVTNMVHINVDATRRYYTVRAVLNGNESVPCNTLKYPGDTIYELRMRVDGEDEVLRRYTNAPAGAVGMFYWNVWQNYDQ